MKSYAAHRLSLILFAIMVLGSDQVRAKEKPGDPLSSRGINFNDHWKFKLCETSENESMVFKASDYNDSDWEPVTLPHTPRIEPLVVNDQWQGICWYRKSFSIGAEVRGKKVFIEFEGAMHTAEIWVNGHQKTRHYGGYLPFTVDISDDVVYGQNNLIAVRLDNRDNPEVPPGKPLRELDFCWYGGLYRNVKMHVTDRLHITDAVAADKTAGGGIFVQFPNISSEQAQVLVQTHLLNEHEKDVTCKLVTQLYDHHHNLVAENTSQDVTLGVSEDQHLVQTLTVQKPRLWHPDAPNLYELHSLVYCNGEIVDRLITQVGIRHIFLSAAEGFKINGERFFLHGTNRHQEYPYIGYALPDNANYRDALKIKQAGFDFVRLSHYPHAPAFLDACDRLGILVMDAIPGWQFFGDELFQQRSYQDCRDMIRRDRNHPSVILWEVSLNESGMTPAFMDSTNRIAHEEYPGDQCYTCGWQDYAYDAFIPARQHASAPDYWKKYAGNRPLFIAEYGDWEYFAQDAGFNQAEFKNLSPEERNSRQSRCAGEKRLLQQALNFQEALNDNLASPASGCANWVMFDYNRGYADDIETSGIVDIFRLPKPGFYFYASQRPPNTLPDSPVDPRPMVHIASAWSRDSNSRVKIFSNCEQVTLLSNGKKIGTQNPDGDLFSNNLSFPPFTFVVEKFQPGDLEAIGFIDGKQAAHQKVTTPLEAHCLQLSSGCDGVQPTVGEKDAFFVYTSVVDKNGTLVTTAADSIMFKIDGPGKLIGANPVAAEAGIAAILVETDGERGDLKITASNTNLPETTPLRIEIK
jgi:beta-galactosidase